MPDSSHKIHVFSPIQYLEKIKKMTPPLPNMQFIHYSDKAMDQLDSLIKSKEIVLIWADLSIVNKLSFPENESHPAERIGLIGAGISAAHAALFGKTGCTNVFDIHVNTEEFTQWMLDIVASRRVAAKLTTDIRTPDLNEVIIGTSRASILLKNLIQKVSARDRLTVLVLGETGSGKGLVAKSIHNLSPRKQGPYIEINCSAIPDSLVEAELFGHERGAFTDAHKSRRGIFELAHGGTLFLDELGFLKQELQVKLLKVLEDKRFRRIGGEKDIQVDCRIIAGTSIDLEKAVKDNTFRSDLFYRLNVFPIRVPPLRDRKEDIPTLAQYFLKYYCQEHSAAVTGFDRSAIDYLLSCDWPGNVRELKHSIERAVIVSENPLIGNDSFSLDASATNSTWAPAFSTYNPSDESKIRREINPTDLDDDQCSRILRIAIPESGKTLEEIQREIIEKILEMTDGNRSQAARLLKISRSRLLRKLTGKEEADLK